MPSREKGSIAERQVAEMLKKWWAPIEPNAIFKRTPGSGAWGHGEAARAAFRTAGDIVTDSTKWPFAVEVKRREAWSWKPLLEGKGSPVWKWWGQAIAQGIEMNAVPMLWFRKNREPWHILFPFGALPCSDFSILDHTWLSSELNVDVHPCLIRGDKFLELPPQMLVNAAHDWLKLV